MFIFRVLNFGFGPRYGLGSGSDSALVERRVRRAQTIDDFDFMPCQQPTLSQGVQTGHRFGAVS
jgi:hypothetical protein